MVIIEHAPDQAEILDFINDALRQLQGAGVEPKYILMGPKAYEALRYAMAARFRRQPGTFETYNYIPIVVDPFRDDTVCVLPAPIEIEKGVQAYRMSDLS